MSVKSINLLIFTIALSFSLQAQVKKYGFGDSVFVWASSLDIRESPKQTSPIIGKVYFGSQVVIVDDSINKTPYKYRALEPAGPKVDQRSKAFYLSGFWVKVKFNSTVGFVFDGYLSKTKTKPSGDDKFGLLESWAKNDLKLKSKRVVNNETESAWTEYFGMPDIIRIRVGHDAKSSFREVKFKNISFEEGSMLGLKLFEGSYLMESRKGQFVFKSNDPNGDCTITITKKSEWIVVSLSCNC